MKSSTCLRTALLLLTGSAALVARADYPSTVLSQGPAVYYRLNELTAPAPLPLPLATNIGSTGPADNGTLVADPFHGIPGPLAGGNGAAYRFDGVSQWVTTPFDTALSTPTFSVEAWVKPTTAHPSGGLLCILSDINAGSPRSGWLLYQSDVAANGGVGAGFNLRMYNTNATTIAFSVLGAATLTPGTWYHVAATYDGTTASVYVNGVLAGSGTFSGGFATGSSSTYVPDLTTGFTMGVRGDGAFAWPGGLSEVAYYSGALSPSQVSAHFAAATTNATGYATQILAANPLVYYRLNEGGEPLAANLGTFGSDFNGAYVINATPGQPGVSLPGFGANNDSVFFDGNSGYVKIPNLNLNSATVTMTAWLNLQGDSSESPNAGIVFCDSGLTQAGLKFDISNPNGLSYNWSDPVAANFASGLTVPSGPQWAFVALIVHPDHAVLALEDGTSFTTATNFEAHEALPFAGLTLIGSDGGASAKTFNGNIDEVAIFNRSLGLGEVYTEYAAAIGTNAPVIFQDPQGPTNTVYAGDTVTLAVDAGGTPPLFYQWVDGSTPISGATGTTLTLANVTNANTGSYSVIVSNAFGAVQSAAASLTVTPLNPPAITTQPVGRTVYPGGTFDPFVVATGGALSYQWKIGGTPIPGATSASYTIASVTSANAGTYSVSVSNRLGVINSSAAVLTVTAPLAGSYESVVLNDSPKAWWRLNDAPGSTTMKDSMGRFDGAYIGAITLGAPGLPFANGSSAATFPGSPGNYGEVPYSPVLNSEVFTVEAWVQTTNETGALGVFSSFSYNTAAAGGTASPYDGKGYFIQRTTSDAFQGGIGENDQYQFYFVDMGPEISNKWTQIVVSYGANNLTYYQDGVNNPPGGYGDFVRDTAIPFLIGAIVPGANGGPESYWDGQIADVSYYTTQLTPAQIAAHYNAALYGTNTPPVFIIQPTNLSVYVGQTATLNAHVEGSVPLSRQWLKGGNPVAGATNDSLTIASAALTDAGTYQLRATNSAGTTLGTAVTLTVTANPSFINATNGLVLHLKFDNAYTDSSGLGNNATPEGSPSFTNGVIGSALSYANSATGTVNNYVDFATDPLPLTASQDFSVAYWIQYPNVAFNQINAGVVFPNCDLPVFGNSYGATYQNGFCIAQTGECENNGGTWIWTMLDGNGVAAQAFGASDTLDDAQWHSLVFTFDRTNTANTYLDGALVDATSIVGLGDLNGAPAPAIGNAPGGGYTGSAGAGNIDDFGLWNRVLTPYEAYSIYYVGKHLGQSFDAVAPITISIQKSGSGYSIAYSVGTLLSAPTVNGPWTPVAGASAPLYQFTPATTGNRFYRVQQ